MVGRPDPNHRDANGVPPGLISQGPPRKTETALFVLRGDREVPMTALDWGIPAMSLRIPS
jgi:hypothetical protein